MFDRSHRRPRGASAALALVLVLVPTESGRATPASAQSSEPQRVPVEAPQELDLARIDALLAELDDEALRVAAREQLVALGPAIAARLVERYGERYPATFGGAFWEVHGILQVLEAFGPAMAAELPQLALATSRSFQGPATVSRESLTEALGEDPVQHLEKRLDAVVVAAGPAGVRALVWALGGGADDWRIVGRLSYGQERSPAQQAELARDLLDGESAPAAWTALILARSGSGAELVTARLGSPELDQRRAGARAALAFGHLAEELVPYLVTALEDPDREVRLAAAAALGNCGALAAGPLARSLTHTDPALRRAAAERLQGLRWPHQADRFDRRRSAYGAFGPRPVDPTYSDKVEDQAVERALGEVAPLLCAALDDEDPFVRAAVAVTLLRTGPALAPLLERLEERRDKAARAGDHATRFWLDELLAQARRPRWAALADLAAERADQAVELAPEELARLAADLRAAPAWELSGDRTWPAQADTRWQTALALIDGGHAQLLAAVDEGRDLAPASADPLEPAQLLDELEQLLEARVGDLLDILDETWGVPSKASTALVELGPAALPAMAYDYLSYPRFPIGPPTYEELVFCLENQGPAATAIYAEALEHWREFGRRFAKRGLLRIGPEALPVVPQILRAWRCEGADDRLPFSDDWWDQPDVVEELFRALGPGARPLLEASSDDPNPVVRARVARALDALGPK